MNVRTWIVDIARRRLTAAVGANLTIAASAYVLAFALRFDLTIPTRFLPILLATLPLLLCCRLVAFWTNGLLANSWGYVNLRDVEQILRSTTLGSVLFLAAMVFALGLRGFPRAIFLLDLLLCTAGLIGVRLAIRVARERRRRPTVRRVETLALIVGAGDAGIRLLEEIESRRRLKFAVAGFVDDDPAKLGLRICGTPVLGKVADLPALVAEHDIGEVLVATPSASGPMIRAIVQRCVEAKVRYRVLPTLGELVEGRVMYTQMREVRVDDLLAREPVRLDLPRVRSLAAGHTVLVTGAAGSIGSELCRQLAGYGPARLVLFDRHENGMFALEMELRARFPSVDLVPVLGDVLLEDQLRRVFSFHRPELVFHAAAYKHVPLAERNILEAVRNNILGTRNVAEAAVAHGTREFVLVSTDKAVQPTSVMGVTKRIAEMLVQGLQNHGCRFVAVRFGNVLGSNGSVVPLFRDQIARGGPVTVTHPQVTRYFMTIPEAVQLILQAATLGRGGEIFLLEMGEPVPIVDLARHMIRLSGFEPDEDIEIVFTGLRPGEKLHEELMGEGEEIAATYHERIRVLQGNASASRPAAWIAEVERCVTANDVESTVHLLQSLVPTYDPSGFLTATFDDGTTADDASAVRPLVGPDEAGSVEIDTMLLIPSMAAVTGDR